MANYRLLYRDKPKSDGIMTLYSHLIIPKHCYDNVFNITFKTDLLIQNSSLKIGFGAICLTNSIVARHCFIYDEKKHEVIDWTKSVLGCYLVKYFTLSEYASALTKDPYPDLRHLSSLICEYEKFREWSTEHNKVCFDI